LQQRSISQTFIRSRQTFSWWWLKVSKPNSFLDFISCFFNFPLIMDTLYFNGIFFWQIIGSYFWYNWFRLLRKNNSRPLIIFLFLANCLAVVRSLYCVTLWYSYACFAIWWSTFILKRTFTITPLHSSDLVDVYFKQLKGA